MSPTERDARIEELNAKPVDEMTIDEIAEYGELVLTREIEKPWKFKEHSRVA